MGDDFAIQRVLVITNDVSRGRMSLPAAPSEVLGMTLIEARLTVEHGEAYCTHAWAEARLGARKSPPGRPRDQLGLNRSGSGSASLTSEERQDLDHLLIVATDASARCISSGWSPGRARRGHEGSSTRSLAQYARAVGSPWFSAG